MVSARQAVVSIALLLLGLALLSPVAGRVSADRQATEASTPVAAVAPAPTIPAVDVTDVPGSAGSVAVDAIRSASATHGADGPTGRSVPDGDAASSVSDADAARSVLSSGSTTSTPDGTARRSAPAPVTFTIVAGGDVLPHGPVIAAARRRGRYDFRPLLAGIRGPVSKADLALCHLEVPLTRDLNALSGYPVFNAPHHLADALASIGFDGCSVASNHALDKGPAGVASTLRALAAADLGATGTARTPRERRRIRTYRVRGVRVAHLSFTYGLNGHVPPRRWMVNVIEPRAILADARRARRRGADAVVVSLHWGREYQSTPTSEQRRLAKRLLASSAVDVIIGHHAHVVQPVARRRGKVVAYGLGNLLSNQTAACCVAATQDGVLLRLIATRRPNGVVRVRRVEYIPTMVRHPGRRVVAVRRALRRASTPAERRQLRASLGRTRSAIGDQAVLAR